MGVRTIAADRLARLTPVSHHIAELVNIAPDPHQPFVGVSAFAHKAGLHTSAIARSRDAYEHVAPDTVGNGTRFVVSEMAGRSTIALKAEQLGLDLDDAGAGRRRREAQGPRAPRLPLRGGRRVARAADAVGDRVEAVVLPSGVAPGHHRAARGRRLRDRGDREGASSATTGSSPPPRATDRSTPSTPPCARRSARSTPQLAHVHLTDFKVRVLDTSQGHRRGHPGAHRLDRRRPHLDDHRRVGERHRGVLGGPGGFDRVRVAPRRRAGPATIRRP